MDSPVLCVGTQNESHSLDDAFDELLMQASNNDVDTPRLDLPRLIVGSDELRSWSYGFVRVLKRPRCRCAGQGT